MDIFINDINVIGDVQYYPWLFTRVRTIASASDTMSLPKMIRTSPHAAVITDPRRQDNPIIECNVAFMKLTGYERDEIIGQNCRFLAGNRPDPATTEVLRSTIRNQEPALVEVLNYKKDGTPFRNAVLIAPIFDQAGDLEYFLGSQMEVHADLTLENTSRRSAADARIAALSRRKREVLQLMAAGKLSKQIAHDLGLSVRTVELYRLGVLRALEVRTAADAIRVAIEAGF